MKLISVYFLILLFTAMTLSLFAAEKTEKWGLGFQPIIGYDDETDWVFGSAGVFYFNPDTENMDQELDEFDLTGTYNLRGGYEINADLIKNIKGNDRVLEISTGYQNVINDYYGPDGKLGEPDKITYTSIDFPFEISYSFKVFNHLFLSPVYDFTYHHIKDVENDQTVSNGETEGHSSFSSGIGIKTIFKTTNPGLYKRRGFVIEAGSIYYSPVLGSDSSFETYGMSYRHYIPVIEKCVFGFNLDYEGVAGDVPSNYIPELGGNKILRGFSSSKYTGKNRLAGQAEFRFPIWWRFGATVFAGAGEAEDKFSDFGKNIKSACGLGFRVAVKREQDLNIRFDISYNSDGDIKPYIKIKEAF